MECSIVKLEVEKQSVNISISRQTDW